MTLLSLFLAWGNVAFKLADRDLTELRLEYSSIS
jgi:hypothetical protein